jgi:hypothetical protein
VGSIYFASLFATGENYVIRKVKGGVKCPGDILSRGVGMNDIHVICLYALLGNRTFADMMKNIFNQDLDGLVGDFLVRLKRDAKRRKMIDPKELERDAKQRKVIDRKKLENRVSKGDKLDAADEATLSKLTVANESCNMYHRDAKRTKVVDRNELENRVSNGEELDAADEAK